MPIYPERKTEIFGNRVQFCGGKLHVSADWKISLVMAFVIIFATSILCTSTIDYFSSSVDVAVVNPGWIVAAIINGIIAIGSLTNLFLCVFVEPGIIPPQIYYDKNGLTNPDPVPENFEDLESRHWNRKVTITLPDGGTMEYEEQICPTCRIWRPPRSAHDWMDDVCIEEFDHKCTVIGAAVGKRNFAYFYMFNVFTSLLSVSLIATVGVCFGVGVRWSELSGAKADAMTQWRFASGILVILSAVIGGSFTWQFAVKYTIYSCQGINVRDERGWRTEAKVLATLERANKSDCETCVGKSCVVSLPESKGPY